MGFKIKNLCSKYVKRLKLVQFFFYEKMSIKIIYKRFNLILNFWFQIKRLLLKVEFFKTVLLEFLFEIGTMFILKKKRRNYLITIIEFL